MRPSLVLYDNFNAVCGQKVRFVLEENGLPYARCEVDLRAGETLRPEYLALNSNGVVPTLVHHGRPVIESTVICEYLDEVFSEPRLCSDDPHARARMRIWIELRAPILASARAAVEITGAGCPYFNRCVLGIEGTCNVEKPPLRRYPGGQLPCSPPLNASFPDNELRKAAPHAAWRT